VKSKGLLKLVIGIGVVAVLAITVPLMSGCRAPAAPEEVEPIKIGMPYYMTGAMARDGVEIKRGTVMAVEEINSAGGLLGRPLEIVEADLINCAPEDVTTAYNLLMAAGVDVNIAGYFLGPVGVHTFGKSDVPLLNASAQQLSLDAVLENKEEYWNIFDGAGGERGYEESFTSLTELLPYEYPNKKVAILTTDFGYSIAITDYFREDAIEAGWEIVLDEIHPFGNTEYGVQLAKIREEKPSLIAFTTVHGAEVISFFTDFIEDPIDSIIWAQYVVSIPEFTEVMGEKSNGVFGSGSYPPEADAWDEKYLARWGEVKTGAFYGPFNYDAVHIWAEAVKRVGDPTDYRAICQAFIDYPYEGWCGRFVFDPDTQAVNWGGIGKGTVPVTLFQVQEQRVIPVLYDDKLANEFQMPWWIER